MDGISSDSTAGAMEPLQLPLQLPLQQHCSGNKSWHLCKPAAEPRSVSEAALPDSTHPTQEDLGSGDELMVDNPLGKQAIFISRDSGGGGVQLGQGGGLTQGLVPVVSGHAPRQAVGKAYQQSLPQPCCAACVACDKSLPACRQAVSRKGVMHVCELDDEMLCSSAVFVHSVACTRCCMHMFG